MGSVVTSSKSTLPERLKKDKIKWWQVTHPHIFGYHADDAGTKTGWAIDYLKMMETILVQCC